MGDVEGDNLSVRLVLVQLTKQMQKDRNYFPMQLLLQPFLRNIAVASI